MFSHLHLDQNNLSLLGKKKKKKIFNTFTYIKRLYTKNIRHILQMAKLHEMTRYIVPINYNIKKNQNEPMKSNFLYNK